MARIPSRIPSRKGEPLAEPSGANTAASSSTCIGCCCTVRTLAEGWLTFFTAVRQRTELPGRYRELAILRVAMLNDAEYEFTLTFPLR